VAVTGQVVGYGRAVRDRGARAHTRDAHGLATGVSRDRAVGASVARVRSRAARGSALTRGPGTRAPASGSAATARGGGVGSIAEVGAASVGSPRAAAARIRSAASRIRPAAAAVRAGAVRAALVAGALVVGAAQLQRDQHQPQRGPTPLR
jgi:hypothetical protein